MIANFPDPYPEELLFSVLARFGERMGYPAAYASNLEMFGVRHGVPAVELPNRIDHLVFALPPGANYTSDSVIQNHTLFPLYAPFLPEKNRELILGNMMGNGSRTTLLRSGITAGRVRPPMFFKACPACDKQNVTQYGETYWDRRHQVSGVQVCPVHRIFLEDTNVRFRWALRKDALISAQSAERAVAVRPIDTNNIHDRVRLQIAHSVAWLLEQNASRPGPLALNLGYREMLAQNGLLCPKGWIRLKNLYRLFAERCPQDLLDQFGCQLRDGGDGGWLGRLLRETEQTIAPLRHLLVLAVLGVSAEEFFTRIIPDSARCSQSTRYPCLNPICPEFQKGTIPGFEFKRAKKGVARIFTCPVCGHRSSRSADGSAVNRVVQFGAHWEAKLKVLWADTSLSLRSLSAQLNADARSVLKYAARLGLEFPRRGPTRLTHRSCRSGTFRHITPCYRTEDKRQEWRKLRRTHSRASIAELHRLAPALYTWMYRHDRAWMIQNSPACRRRVPKNDRVDWNVRDTVLVAQVVAAADRIKNGPGRPRRVTVRSIGLELGIPVVLKTRKKKLPLTRATLDANVESTEAFVLRRLRWAVDSLKNHAVRVNRSYLMRIAGIGTTALSFLSVRQAIAVAITEFSDVPNKMPRNPPRAA